MHRLHHRLTVHQIKYGSGQRNGVIAEPVAQLGAELSIGPGDGDSHAEMIPMR